MAASTELDIAPISFAFMLAGEGKLTYRHAGHPIRMGSIGPASFSFEDLVVPEEPPPSYWDEIVAWCQDHSIKETIQFTPLRSPPLAWTSEQFDFAIEVSKPNKKGIFALTQLYLIDYFEGPHCNVLRHASTQIGAPEVLGLLREKLFRLGATGLQLKSKYRSWPNVDISEGTIPLPLTSHLIRAIQRRFYFNRSMLLHSAPGLYTELKCRYALLSPTALESIPQRLTNLINTGNPDQLFDKFGAIGPSWFCTLNHLLKKKRADSSK